MLSLSERPWLRPLALLLVGAVVLVLVNRLALGWPWYVVGLVAFALGLGLLIRGTDQMTRGPEIAIAVSCLLVLGGLWLLHPQGWQAPGFTISGTTPQVKLVGRLKSTIVLEDKGVVTGYDISTQQPVWHHPATGPVAMQDRKVLFQDAAHPTLALALRPKTGSHFPTTVPWPSSVKTTPTGQLVRRGPLWAQLVTAHDIAGDTYTSLVVHKRDGSETTYRVSNVTSLSLRGGVLLLSGPTPRLLLVAMS